MSTTCEAVSPVCTMASAVSPSSNSFVVSSSFHNLTNHVILSSPNREDVNLNLSSSSSFLSNYSSVCSSNPAKSSIPSNFTTSSFAYSSDTKENNNSCPVSSSTSMSQAVEQVAKEVQDNDAKSNGPTQHETEVSSSSRPSASEAKCSATNDDAIMNVEEVKQPEEDGKAIVMTVFDENSSNSNSTQSSENTNGSGRKRTRRRGEGQLLMQDLIGIDKSLADGIANHLKSTPTQSSSSDGPSTEQNDLSNQTGGEGEPKKSKEDSPAFHLRPRRSHKGASYSGYCSSSGSNSPISFYFSPVKRSKQTLIKKSLNNYTQQLLSDTSKQLSQFLNDQQSHSGHNDSCITISSSNSTSFDSKDDLDVSLTPKPSQPQLRAYSRSILRDVDVSVFAELITPVDLTYSKVYTSSYLALQVVDIKPLRYVNIQHPDSGEKLSSPLLELNTLDINDRFSLKHTRGIFDDSSFR